MAEIRKMLKKKYTNLRHNLASNPTERSSPANKMNFQAFKDTPGYSCSYR